MPRYRTSLTTPTMVRHCGFCPGVNDDMKTLRPSGSCPGHNRRAVLSLTIATRGASAVSCAVKKRPARSGTRMAAKKPGVAAW